MAGDRIEIKFDDIRDNEDPVLWMRRCFRKLLKNLLTDRIATGEIRLNDRVSIIINSRHGFEPIHVSFRRPDQLTVDVILDRIHIVANSNKEFLIDQALTINFDHIRMPTGAGGVVRLRGCTMEEYAQRKYGLISYKTPVNHRQEDDYSCLAYSLVTSYSPR